MALASSRPCTGHATLAELGPYRIRRRVLCRATSTMRCTRPAPSTRPLLSLWNASRRLRLLNTIGMRDGSAAAFGKGYNILPIWKERTDSRAWFPTPNGDVIYSLTFST